MAVAWLVCVLLVRVGAAANGDGGAAALDGRGAGPPVTSGTLIGEMWDLEGLTRFPGAGVRVVQFSSYDRRSSVPGGPDWFGNSDGFGSEPIPNFEGVVRQPGADGVGEYLICDVQQPGAIVRTWTAAMEGTIRVTLDGGAAPVFDGPAETFLKHRAAHFLKGSAGADAVGAFEQRYADYFPVPFAKSCRIVWTGDLRKVHFYHVEVREYPAGTAVETFSPDDGARYRDAAVRAREKLAPGPPGSEAQPPEGVTLAPGERKEFAKFEGTGAIVELRARIAGAEAEAGLRGTVLRMAFDGHQTPQVVCPVGDFFGAAPGVVPYESLPMSVKDDGWMVSRFVMPYQKGAAVSAENRTGAPVKVAIAARTGPYEWDGRSMHFRAHWRADHDLTARGGRDAVDLPFLSTHGEGVYVGTAVYIMSPCPVPTAGGNWWGEGDEKVFVDGEARPSIFGTGSEDYFNYAWSESDIFQYPYFAQPICTGPETRGYITNNRWHILDAIPFERSLSFFMELYSHTPTPRLSYCRVSYWYARPGAYDDGPALNGSDLRVPALLAWTVRAAGGAAGAAIFEAEEARDPSSPARVVEDVRYSAGKLVRFTGPEGKLRVRAEKAGRYQVVLTCASGPEKAGFGASIDGAVLKHGGEEKFELMTAHFERLVNIWCEAVELGAGEHTLTLSAISGAPGIDFVWVKPVKE